MHQPSTRRHTATVMIGKSARLAALAPATLALLIQVFALAVIVVGSMLTQQFWAIPLPLPALVFAQALFAVLLCMIGNMAVWWRWIHAFFLPALWVMSAWAIPNTVYLAGFILCLTMFWTTFRSQVPFFPSRPMVWQQLINLLPNDESRRVIDIGSGLGDLAMSLAAARKNSRIEGVEIAPLPWLISRLRAFFKRSSARFIRGDYEALSFAAYDMVFAYLSPVAMPALWQKAKREMRSGSLLVSYAFEIPDVPPNIVIRASSASPPLFVWKIA